MTEEAKTRERWHIGKTINAATIVTVVFAAATVVGMWYRQEGRIEKLETQQNEINARIVRILEQQERYDSRQDNEIRAFRTEMRTDVRDIQLKLDRLLERVADSGE